MLLPRMRIALSALAALALSAPASATQVVVTVAGNDNPFLAGQPAGTPCCSGDTATDQSPTLAVSSFAPGSLFTFSGTGGFLNAPGTPFGLDGGSNFAMASSHFGISGLVTSPLSALVGVFLNDDVPNGIPPAQRDDGTSFTTLAPGLGQIFFIGDGLTGTGSGTVQQFTAPAGATRLYLGSADGFGWFNNIGEASVTIDFDGAVGTVPEPATWAMLLLGFGMIGASLRGRRPSIAALG